MKLFPEDSDVVLYETAFENDILDRKLISKQLSELVERIETPIVLALDDKWGSGKTYFLKRWVAAHTKENSGSAVTVYFDAFESDYISDPLVSIITAISGRIPKKQQKMINRWKSVATKLAKPAFGVALSLATFGAKQHLEEIGDVLVEAASSEVKDATHSLWDAEKERKDAVQTFRELLIQLTDEQKSSIVIVIDELDRCRPDYALLVLEVIKHFFTVPNVHFILGINGRSLENSVRARYGVDIDAEAYLRKFINLSFSLPNDIGPRNQHLTVVRYAEQLIVDMQLPTEISKRCTNLIYYVAKQNDVSLRDIGKIFSKIALLPDKVTNTKKLSGWIDILCILLVSSVVDPKIHKKFVLANASSDEIRNFLGASWNKTTEQIENSQNRDYDHQLTVWLAITLYACGPDSALNDNDLSKWKDNIAQQFDRWGSPDRPKQIARTIQKDWVDIFNIISNS